MTEDWCYDCNVSVVTVNFFKPVSDLTKQFEKNLMVLFLQ